MTLLNFACFFILLVCPKMLYIEHLFWVVPVGDVYHHRLGHSIRWIVLYNLFSGCWSAGRDDLTNLEPPKDKLDLWEGTHHHLSNDLDTEQQTTCVPDLKCHHGDILTLEMDTNKDEEEVGATLCLFSKRK